MNARIRARVERATVTFPQRGGRGVLVPGHLIVTAAHCVDWTNDGGLALGDLAKFIEPIQTHDGRELQIYPCAVELAADIAILGAVDDGREEEAEAFRAFCDETRAVRLDTTDLVILTPHPAYVFGLAGWVAAQVTLASADATSLTVTAEGPLPPGTSGSPVMSDRGRLLGVVSSAHGLAGHGHEHRDGIVVRPHVAAPVWCVQEMTWSAARKRARRRRAFDRQAVVPRPTWTPPDGIG